MSTVYILRRADGGMSILRPLPRAEFDLGVELAKWVETAPADWLPVAAPVAIDPMDLPGDRTFRDAWELTGQAVKVAMPKAVEIVRQRLRDERAPELERLDAQYLRALEERDTNKQAVVAAQKIALREITDRSEILNARTPDALVAAFDRLQSEIKRAGDARAN